MIPIPEEITKSFLLSLPSKKWNETKEYDYLYIVPTDEKHDSGFALIAIIGVIDKEVEIAAMCDDVCWTFPKKHPYEKIKEKKLKMILRTDCLYPSGILRMWASSEHYFKGKFRIGCSLSSTDVELFLIPVGKNQMTGEVFEP